MIGEFNRQNPYVVQIIENMEPLKHKTMNTTITFIKYLLGGFFVSVIFCIGSFSIQYIPFYVFIFLVDLIVSFLHFKMTMEINPIAEMTRIIYGNQYEKIFVNNEVLLNIIEDISYFKGMLDSLSESCKHIFIGTSIISIAICIYRWILFFI